MAQRCFKVAGVGLLLRVALALTVTLGACASGTAQAQLAPAPGAWDRFAQPLREANPSENGEDGVEVVVTPGGETVAAWFEYRSVEDGAVWRGVVQRPGQPPGEPFELATGVSNIQLGLSGNGRTLAVWTTHRDSKVMVSERPAGGTFGVPVELGEASNDGVYLGVSSGGDATVAWSERDFQANQQDLPSISRSLGAASTTWSEPRPLPGGAKPGLMALGDHGELAVAWREWSPGSPSRIKVVSRASDGKVSPAQEVGGDELRGLRLHAAGDGRFTISALRESPSAPDGERASLWMAGGTPGEPLGPGRLLPASDLPWQDYALGVARGGRITLAYTPAGKCEGHVLAGPTVDHLALVRRFATRTCAVNPVIAQSPDGHVTISFRVERDPRAFRFPPTPNQTFENPGDLTVAASRIGDSPFGPVQDLRPGCEPLEQIHMATNDQGRTAAVIFDHGRRLLTAYSPSAGGQSGRCLEPALYEQEIPADDCRFGCKGPIPVVVPSAAVAVKSLVLERASVTRSASRRTATLRLRSVRSLRLSFAGTLAPRRGRLVAQGRRRARVRAGLTTIRIALRATPTRRARASRRSPLVLRVSVKAVDARGKPVRRIFTAPVPAG